jgi:hypothetical protein
VDLARISSPQWGGHSCLPQGNKRARPPCSRKRTKSQAAVAQLVEHRLPKPNVAGPNPVCRSSERRKPRWFAAFCLWLRPHPILVCSRHRPLFFRKFYPSPSRHFLWAIPGISLAALRMTGLPGFLAVSGKRRSAAARRRSPSRHSLGSTGSLSKASTPKTHSWTRRSGSR